MMYDVYRPKEGFMTQKLSTIAILVLLLLAIVSFAQQQGNNSASPGRYQLRLVGTSSKVTPWVYRIDTVTGVTTQLQIPLFDEKSGLWPSGGVWVAVQEPRN